MDSPTQPAQDQASTVQNGGKLMAQIKELKTQLAAALEINRRYESEIKRLKNYEEKVDPEAGSGPVCEAMRLHRAEVCKSKWTAPVETKTGTLHLCNHHAKIFLGKNLPDVEEDQAIAQTTAQTVVSVK